MNTMESKINNKLAHGDTAPSAESIPAPKPIVRKKRTPFAAIKLSPQEPHAEIIFEEAEVLFRATYNLSDKTDRLSRGTIGIWDSDVGRFKQVDPSLGSHKFKGAMQKDLIIPSPSGSETQTEIIEQTTRQKANELIQKYRSLIVGALRANKALPNISLGQAIELYAADYIADKTTSIQMRTTYRNQLLSLANFWGEKAIKEIRAIDLSRFCKAHGADNGIIYIKNLQSFLNYTATHIGVTPPITDVLSSFLQKAQKEDPEKTARNRQREAANSDVLPQIYENKLDQGCWDHLGNPLWGIIVLLKEGGLHTTSACNIRIQDIVRTNNHEEVYILLRRDDIATYTHDYSFPLTPFGGSYISKYLDFLQANSPPERMSEGKYLFSEDNGTSPLDTKTVNAFAREQLSTYLFGYAGRVQLNRNLTVSMGTQLLIDTRKKHLLEDSRFDNDNGAILFLMHQALSRMVQADSYRCFTDFTGRKSLFRRLSQDRHGCLPKEIKYTRMSNVLRGGYRELRFPPKHNSHPGHDELITLEVEGLLPGDHIEAICSDGCYLHID